MMLLYGAKEVKNQLEDAAVTQFSEVAWCLDLNGFSSRQAQLIAKKYISLNFLIINIGNSNTPMPILII